MGTSDVRIEKSANRWLVIISCCKFQTTDVVFHQHAIGVSASTPLCLSYNSVSHYSSLSPIFFTVDWLQNVEG
jgi:hypothetical protein